MPDSPHQLGATPSLPEVYKEPAAKAKHLIPILGMLGILLAVGIVLYVPYASHIISVHRPFLKQALSSPSPLKASLYKPIPNQLYPLSQSKDGRDVYYSYDDLKGKVLRFAGIGTDYYPKGTLIAGFASYRGGRGSIKVASDSAMIDYMVGQFARWDSIPNSPDRYLLLKNDSGIHQNNKLIYYPKIRVGFGPLRVDLKHTYSTGFGLEDLSSVIPKTLDPAHGVKQYPIGPVGSLGPQTLNLLVRPNDVIAVTFVPDPAGTGDLKDSGGVLVARAIFIRRFDAKDQIQRETGKDLTQQ